MLTLATAVVRAWTWVYTHGVDPDARDDRRAQIDSDIWESIDDCRDRGLNELSTAAQMIARLVTGIGDDLLWRGEQLDARAAVVALGIGDAASQPIAFRRMSSFGASATVHAVLMLIAVWAAPHFSAAALRGNSAVGSPVVFVASSEADVAARRSAGFRPAATPDDNLGIRLGRGESTVSVPGFTLNFAKVIARAGTLFPFVTGTLSLERIAAAAMLPKPTAHMTNPFSRADGDGSGLPALDLSAVERQALIDRAWARRDRWNAFEPLASLAENYNPNAGAIPLLFREYVEQNGLQPYVETGIRDPRLWVQLGVVADHADFVDFISRYVARHPSTKAATELLFLLDTLVQGSYDTIATLLDVIPEEDLGWTRQGNPAAFDAVSTIQRHYRAEVEWRGIGSKTALRMYFDEARLSILGNLLQTTPAGYRADDARFLVGSIYWRQKRTAEAIAAWSAMTGTNPSDRYHEASAQLRDAIAHPGGDGIDAVRIDRILDGERGRWISFSHDRLKQFGFRFNTF